MSSLWIASSVSTTNGSNLVTVQSNEDITNIRPNSLIQVGANPLMEVKRTFLTDSGVKTIELFENWEFGAVTGQRAIAAPTLGEIKSLADDVRQLISSAEEIIETTNLNPAGGSIAKRTSDGRLKAEPATEANDVITKKQTGNAIGRDVGKDPGNLAEYKYADSGLSEAGYNATGAVQAPDSSLDILNRTQFISHSDSRPGGWDDRLGTYPMGVHWRRSPLVQAQIAFGYKGAAGYRVTLDSGSWSAWRKFYDESNICGAVSQSGGVPTGAVIERGSNANGEYVKFADGTLLASVDVELDLTYNLFQAFPFPIYTADANSSVASFAVGNYSFGQDDYSLRETVGSIVVRVRNMTEWNVFSPNIDMSNTAFPIKLFLYGRWY
jgi:hypothetical protein